MGILVGSEVGIVAEGSGASVTPADSGQVFVLTMAQRGPVGEVITCKSDADVEAKLGGLAAFSPFRLGARRFFQNGGRLMHVSRVAGPDAEPGTTTLPGSGAEGLVTSYDVEAREVGDVPLRIGVEVDGAGVRISVYDNGVRKHRSPKLLTVAEVGAWGAEAPLLKVTPRVTATTLPGAMNPQALAGGTGDEANVTNAEWIAALTPFIRRLGFGQIVAYGTTNAAVHAAILEHAAAFNRWALPDMPSLDDEADLASSIADALAASTLGDEAGRHGATYGKHVRVEGTARGATPTIPYSLVQAGMIAAVDRRYGLGQPAAGVYGIPAGVVGLDGPEFTPAQRQFLGEQGYNPVAIPETGGKLRTYDDRTMAPDDGNHDAYQIAAQQRTLKSLAYQCELAGEPHVLGKVTPTRLGDLKRDLVGVCRRFFDRDDLYGDTPDQAFSVTVLDDPELLDAGELHAVVEVRLPGVARAVRIQLIKVPLSRELVAVVDTAAA